MSIILNHQLREQINYDNSIFPIAFFQDELASLPNFTGPLHWHPDFEIATASNSDLDFQIGRQHILLKAGDSIFVNGNMLHGIKQLPGSEPDPISNIVFSGTIIAPESSIIYQKYIHPISSCDTLPYIVFRQDIPWGNEVNKLIKNIYVQMQKKSNCYEMVIQRELNAIFEYIFSNFEDLPKFETSRIHLNAQIRVQKMLTFIYEHYTEAVTLEDIANAANISRSEAGRCFNTYIGCSPVDALIQYRLQTAQQLLKDTTLSTQEIAFECGFNSVNYFIRQYRKTYGFTPGQNRK